MADNSSCILMNESPTPDAGLELDQYVDVALGPEILAEHGPKDCQPANAVGTAKRFDSLSWNLDVITCHSYCSYVAGVDPFGNLIFVV